MKRFLVFLITIFTFVNIVRADTETLQWYVDGNIYATTTCESGGNVILPTAPAKRGYTFKGWQKDSFNRGTYTSWSNVPSVNTGYAFDIYDNRTPKENDYIIVEDTTDYVSDINPLLNIKTKSTSGSLAQMTVRIIDTAEEITVNHTTAGSTKIGTTDCRINYGDAYWKLSCDKPFVINNVLYSVGSLYRWRYDSIVDFDVYSGTWRFVYHGIWENDGKDGWKPDVQINE